MQKKYNFIPILISLIIIGLATAITYFQPSFLGKYLIREEQGAYDEQIRYYHKPLSPHTPIVIVDIDDRSINVEGRWPWNRAKIAALLNELHRLGAAVIALDLFFPENSLNPIEEILEVKPQLQNELKDLNSQFDADGILAKSLESGTNCLAFAFTTYVEKEGVLPKPFYVLPEANEQTSWILNWPGYLGNIPILQDAAKNGGCVTATVDQDGILRFTPLLFRQGVNVYESLALKATELFLKQSVSYVATETINKKNITKSIKLGDITIPTDPWARILIPYRGPAFSFPYLSATDVLHGKIEENKVRGKLVFVGTSATANGDLKSTAISAVFPGVEVQATVAAGILDRYLPFKPLWGKEAAAIFIFILGLIIIFILPLMNEFAVFFMFVGIVFLLKIANRWMWYRYGISLSFFFPLPTMAILFLIDIIYAFLKRKRNKPPVP